MFNAPKHAAINLNEVGTVRLRPPKAPSNDVASFVHDAEADGSSRCACAYRVQVYLGCFARARDRVRGNKAGQAEAKRFANELEEMRDSSKLKNVQNTSRE